MPGDNSPIVRHPRLAAWTWDVEDDVVTWSPQLKILLGYEEGDAAPGWSQHDRVVAPHSLPKLKDCVGRCLAVGEPYTLIVDGLRRDGSLIRLEIHGAAVEFKGGIPSRLGGIVIDRSIESSARERLRETKQLLEQVARIGRIGAWFYDVESESLVWSDETFEIHSLSRAYTPTIANLRALYGETVYQEFVRDLGNLIQTGENLLLDVEYRTPAQRFRWLSITGERFVEAGRGIRIVGTVQDVTALRRAQIERDLLFDQTNDLLGIADIDGVFRQVNRAWTEVLGWTSEDLGEMHWLDLIHPNDYSRAREAEILLRRGRSVSELCTRVRCREGSYRWFSWKAVPIITESRVIAILRDVTAQREQALRDHEAEQAIGQAALDERRRLALHMHDGAGQLLTSMTILARRACEDARNPLELRSEFRKLVELSREAHRRIRAITRGLMPEEVNATTFISVVRRLSEACSSGFDVHCTMDAPAAVHLPSDAAALQLHLIIQEAILNAVRHAEPNHIAISIKEGGGLIYVSIRDDGVGFDPDQLRSSPEGLGLRSMQTRAVDCRGKLTIRKVQPRGTEVVCIVPLDGGEG